MKFEKFLTDLKQTVDNSKSPVLCWSGGKDSTLILFGLIKELDYTIPILVFPHFWSTYQKVFIKKVINDNNLTVSFYRPIELRYDKKHILAFYNIGNMLMPIVFDHYEDETRCGLDLGEKSLTGPISYYSWDVTICGTKKVDKHELYPKGHDFSKYTTDFHRMEFPLWDWTDEEVLEETKKRNYPIDERVYIDNDELADTGNFTACMRCVGKERVFCPKRGGYIQGIYGGLK